VKPVLYVGNRNYSSWSLRPWLVLTWGRIGFELRVIPLGGPGYTHRQMPSVLDVSPPGTVPVLHLGEDIIADSLAISEWAAEKTPALWPEDTIARAHARSAVCEIHSGFGALRGKLPCNIRRRANARELAPDTRREVARVEAIWTSLLVRFGGHGPYLFGAVPTIADAFFTPIATRFRTYSVTIGDRAQAYADALLANPAFRDWEQEGARETWAMAELDAF
jgi:glutathione S-transferase